jgi:hypothetical protein
MYDGWTVLESAQMELWSCEGYSDNSKETKLLNCFFLHRETLASKAIEKDFSWFSTRQSTWYTFFLRESL